MLFTGIVVVTHRHFEGGPVWVALGGRLCWHKGGGSGDGDEVVVVVVAAVVIRWCW